VSAAWPRGAAGWAALLAIALAAQAQQGPRGARGEPAAVEPDRAAAARGSLAAEVGTQLAEVQKRLKLQPDQRAAWDADTRRVESLMEDLLRGVTAPLEHENAPRQINRRVDVVRNRLAAMEDIADAAAQLYAQLSPEQRELADELLPSTVPALYSGLPDLPRNAPGQPGARRKGP